MVATGGSIPPWLRLAARNIYLTRSRALTSWIIMVNGSIRRNTAGCGARAESTPTGRLIAMAIVDGSRPMAGRGFRMNLGAGLLITTGDGRMYATAGVGRRSSISISAVDSIGGGDLITWPSSDGEAI